MKRILLILLSIAICISMIGCNKTIKVTAPSDDYIGRNYLSVISELQKAGFRDIDTTVIEDLSSASSMADGTVEQVLINGSASFVKESSFPLDASVMITYHSIKRICPPISSNDIQSTDYEHLGNMFKDAGFTNVELVEKFDLDPDTTNADYLNEISIDGISVFDNEAEFPYDAAVSVICHRPFEKYTVKVHIDFVTNLIFNKYDVDILVNGKLEYTLGHGDDADYEFRLKPGEYKITFAQKGSSTINGEATIDVSSNMEVSYKILCYSERVAVEMLYIDREEILSANDVKVPVFASDYRYKNYNDIVASLEAIGFTNVKTEAIYDIYFGIFASDGESDKVTIDGKSDFKRGDVFSADAEIIITYHTLAENDPIKQANQQEAEAQKLLEEQLEAIFPKELAKRAAVVAFTNRYATDVIINDAIDATKFHSYDDVSGYFMYEESDGVWTAVNEKTWHVEKLKLIVNDYRTTATVSLDVKYDGENYIVSNLAGNAPSYEDVSIMEDETDYSLYFVVPSELVIEDRDPIKELREDVAKRAFKYMGEALYPYGFECHWFGGTIESWQAYDGSWFFKVEVTITNQYGASRKAIAEAYINNVTESVENFLVY